MIFYALFLMNQVQVSGMSICVSFSSSLSQLLRPLFQWLNRDVATATSECQKTN